MKTKYLRLVLLSRCKQYTGGSVRLDWIETACYATVVIRLDYSPRNDRPWKSQPRDHSTANIHRTAWFFDCRWRTTIECGNTEQGSHADVVVVE
jgi:hypothetical protein